MPDNPIHRRDIDSDEWELADIEAGIADLEAGREIGHEDVARWLNSWDTRRETEPPRF